MDAQERMLMRHEREQKRNLKKAIEAHNKAEKKVWKADDLYGKESPAYKKARQEEREAFANLRVAHGARKIPAGRWNRKKKQALKDASPSAAKVRRQEKEYTTGKAVDISQKEPRERKGMKAKASGGMVGASDMSAGKMTPSPARKKKIPQYYRGGGTVKKGKKYAYGGRVAKYKG